MAMPAGLKRYWATHRRGKRNKTRSVSMARHGHRRAGFTIPVSIVAGFAPLVNQAYIGYEAGGIRQAITGTVTSIIPYDPGTKKVSFSNLGYGLYPILAGMLVHKIVGGALGVNRFLARSGVPWIRL